MLIGKKAKSFFASVNSYLAKFLCQFCQANPVIAQKVLDIIKVAGGVFEPTPAPDLGDHFMTFLEMLNSSDRRNFASPNESLPSKPVGRSEVCQGWQFSSIT